MRCNDITKPILDAIDIMVKRAFETDNHIRIAQGNIVETLDNNPYKYSVKYQNNIIVCFSNSNREYKANVPIYFTFVNGKMNEPKFILGSIQDNCFKE